jgi:hypothetical protein
MVKGKRPKEGQKEPPQESPPQRTAVIRGDRERADDATQKEEKTEKTPSAHAALPIPPAHPFPIRSASSSGGTQLTILQRSPPKDKTKKNKKDEQKGDKGKEETSSQSSQETELDAALPDKKGKKKKVQAKLDTSPKEGSSDDGSEDAATNGSSLPPLGSSGSEEHSPATTDFLAEFLDEVREDNISLYLRNMGELKVLLYNWHGAKEYPELTPIDVSEEIVDEYIDRVLSSSHKWNNEEGVHKTLMEIDIEDNIIRGNDKYVRMLYLRLGKALEPHTKIAKAHAATMKEAAFTWQQRAFKLIEEATCNVRIDNNKTIKDIQNEAQRSANELRKQLEDLTKKHNDLQTEYNFARAALTLKEQTRVGQESAASVSKITELTLELGEQRKYNEELRKQMQELYANFTEYRAGHLKDSIEIDVKEKGKGEPDLNDRRKNRDSESPTWGKIRNTTPSSSDWETKGDISTSQSDFNNGWGKPPPRRKDRRRSPPQDDRRSERQRSPTNSRSSNRDSNYKKRPASPSKEAQPAKRTLSRDAWISGGKEAIAH